jgi:hypothetical protein
MNVAVVTLLRDREYMVDSYKMKVESLTGADVRCYVVEGDSVDSTYSKLKAWEDFNDNVHILKLDLHKPLYGSVVCSERFEILGTCNDYALDLIAKEKWADYILYLQADLIIPRDIITKLADKQKPMIAPMIWCHNDDKKVFFDIWAFRRGNWNFPPVGNKWYYDNMPHEDFEVDSVGSLFLTDAHAVYDGARFGTKEDVVSFSHACKNLGYSVWVAPDIHVRHPCDCCTG